MHENLSQKNVFHSGQNWLWIWKIIWKQLVSAMILQDMYMKNIEN